MYCFVKFIVFIVFIFIKYLHVISYISNNKPILLFHGMGGSILKNEKEEIIYPPSFSQIFFQYKKWKKQILYDKLHTFRFGDKKSLDLHNVSPFCINRNNYGEMTKYDNIFPIPYDFRRIHEKEYLENDFYPKLKEYIENTFIKEPVILLTHSTGGIICHWFLQNQTEEWKKKHIRAVVNVSVPFCGLFFVLKMLILPSIIDKWLGIDILRNMGGIIINMPNPQFFKNVVLTVKNKDSSCINELNEDNYFDLFEMGDVEDKYEMNEQMRESLLENTGVETHIVYTSNKKTMAGIIIHNEKDEENFEYELYYDLGDGVVTKNSLLFPKMWKNQSNVFYHNIKNHSHSNILKTTELKDIINSCSLKNK